MNYTKGEWTNVAKGIIDQLDRTIAILIDGSYEEKRANANLIAAAPDMYEALKAMLEGSEIAPLRPDEPIRVWERAMPSEEAILMGFKALAKAKGKE